MELPHVDDHCPVARTRRWGTVLDAGTGVNSMRWLAGLDTERVVGVTGSERMARQVRDAVPLGPRHALVVGNWSDPGLLLGQRFDVVRADYLIGAVAAFAPYTQDVILARLRAHCRGRLYVTGLEPYVTGAPRSEAGRLVWRLGRLRDACLLLAGEAPYREFPLDWMQRHLERAGFRVVATRRFSIRFGARFVSSQLGMIRDRIGRIPDEALRPALLAHADALEAEALSAVERLGGLRHGADYVVVAEVS
jgi:hypothetical protein